MKRVLKSIAKLLYKSLRGLYRLLPLPKSLKNRIRSFIGRASARLQKSVGFISPEVKERYSFYEGVISEKEAAIYERDIVNRVLIDKVETSDAYINKEFINEYPLKLITNSLCKRVVSSPKIAVQIHIYHTELINEIISSIGNIPYKFDCFISTDTEDKKVCIIDKLEAVSNVNIDRLVVDVYENRGRDIAPFLTQMQSLINDYEYICHIHTKKSITSICGDDWRRYLFRHLFGSEENVKGIINLLENNPELGIVFPEMFPIFSDADYSEENIAECYRVLEKLMIELKLPDSLAFPGGNMFWAKTAAVIDLFKSGLTATDFPEETGQTNGTLAHAVERVWVYVAQSNGFSYLKVLNYCTPESGAASKKRITFYVHYNHENIIDYNDIKSISRLSRVSSEMVFITNSVLPKEEIKKIKPYVTRIISRENKGYDFAAWRDAMLEKGFENLEEYDQLVLINNSVFGPIYDLNAVFDEMDNKKLDFWGITLFEKMEDGSLVGKEVVEEHVQSYFMVFEKNVICSNAFRGFWANVEDVESWRETVIKYETELTYYLSQNGFKYGVLLPETRYLSVFKEDYCSFPYSSPYATAVLGSPFVKRKCLQQASFEEKQKLIQLISQLSCM